MKDSQKVLELTRLCDRFLNKHPFRFRSDSAPSFCGYDIETTQPVQVVRDISQVLHDGTSNHTQRLANARKIIDAQSAQEVLKKTTSGEKFLHTVKCIFTFRWGSICKTPAQLLGESIRKALSLPTWSVVNCKKKTVFNRYMETVDSSSNKSPMRNK